MKMTSKQFGKKLTSLHGAAVPGHEGIVKMLLDYGADKNAKTSTGTTPKDVAQFKRHNSIVQLLDNYQKKRTNIFTK